MKYFFVLLLLLLLAISTYSQETPGYSFKITGITNAEDTKVIIGILRSEYLIKTSFSDATDTFSVPDYQYLNEDQLTAKLNSYGYSVNNFIVY